MDLEQLFCDREGFGIETATLKQRAICRAQDGRALDDLLDRVTETERQGVEAMFGCPADELPTGPPPVEVVDLEPVRCGKSLRCAATAVARSQTVDVSIVKPGEQAPRISLLSTVSDTAHTLRGHLNMINERPMLRALLVGETADSITLRHPSGMPIEIKVIAAHRGGYSLAARWCASVIFDEAPGWNSTDRVVSLEESREQAIGRLLGGAQAIYGGSPWQPSGFCYETWREHFGKPTADLLVIHAAPAWELNNVYWNPARVARVKRTSPRTFQMHLLAEFGAARNAAFDYEHVEGMFEAWVPDLEHEYRIAPYYLAIDPSSLRGDSFAWLLGRWLIPQAPRELSAIVRKADGTAREVFPPKQRVFHIERAGGWDGRLVGRVSMDQIVIALVKLCRHYGIRRVFSDQREEAALAGLFGHYGIGLVPYHWSNESKDQAVVTLRRMMAHGQLRSLDHPQLRQQIIGFGYKLLPTGRYQYQGRGVNDDYCAALMTMAHAINDNMISGTPHLPYQRRRHLGIYRV